MMGHWGSRFFSPKAKKQIRTTDSAWSAPIFLFSHPSILNMIRGLKKDMAIQRLMVLNAEVENNDRPKMKYKNLAVRLSEKVAKYEDEQDKLKYLKAVAFISQKKFGLGLVLCLNVVLGSIFPCLSFGASVFHYSVFHASVFRASMFRYSVFRSPLLLVPSPLEKSRSG